MRGPGQTRPLTPTRESAPALLVLLLLLVALPSLAAGDLPRLRVLGSPWPGGALFVAVDTGGPGWQGEWRWAGRRGPLTPAPYGLRAGLAVPLDAAEGGLASLTVHLTSPEDQTRTLTRRIVIEPVTRSIQRLSMSPDQASRYDDPQADREEEVVLAALRDLRPGQLWRGGFSQPSQAPRSSPFGVRRIRNGRTAGFHRGLDYAGPVGAPVTAPAHGVVSLTGRDYVLLGNCVLLNHGEGLTSLYIHLSQIEVKEGQRVQAGQRLGRIGNTGASTGPHLHYATYFHGEPVDPDLLRTFPKGW